MTDLFAAAVARLAAVMEADCRPWHGDPWAGRPPLNVDRFDADARLDAATDRRHRNTFEPVQ